MSTNILSLIGRDQPLFNDDISANKQALAQAVTNGRFLVLGGAGSIGQAVTKEIFKRNPKKLHVVDLSENTLVELVRDLRSSVGYIDGEFQTFALDIGSREYDAFINDDGEYDYVLNLSALKHVRSERDPYTLMRMIDVNVFNTDKTIRQSIAKGIKKYFCVSTDKAANPVNMMGGSKRIMEMFLMRHSKEIAISTARFANVAFSNGSLLEGFAHRINKEQPIAAPNDVRRYFVTPQESGELCLMSCIFGESRDVFFPKLSEALHLITFSEIAERYLTSIGYTPLYCTSEDEARGSVGKQKNHWPVFFSPSNTTGEKDFEEFYTDTETLDMQRFSNLGVIKNEFDDNSEKVEYFETEINNMREQGRYDKDKIVALFFEMMPGFGHKEVGRYLDSKM